LSHGAQDRGRHSSIGALKLIAEALHGGVESSLIEVKLRAPPPIGSKPRLFNAFAMSFASFAGFANLATLL
jgi:hypothetical protein